MASRGEGTGTDRDRAEPGRLGEALRLVLPALEAFLRFEGQDRAARDRARWRSLLDLPLPETGIGLDATLRELAAQVIPYGLRNGAPGFTGWITTSPTTAAAVAAFAAAIAGSQRWWVQPFNHLETVALAWLARLLGIPASHQGVFTSGGAVANLIGLGAARQHAFERAGIDPARDGLRTERQWRVYASREVHHVVNRAAAVLGLGRRSLALVEVDDRQRLDLRALRAALDADARGGVLPVAIFATAGTVNTGAVDPIGEVVEIARERGIWLHVDGAYGGFGVLDPEVAPLFEGMSEADSVAVDPHKWLAAPLGCGATFVRDRSLLGRAFTLEPAEYLEGSAGTAEPVSPFDDFGDLYHDFSIEQSAQSRGVTVWAILREIGAEGMRERVRRHDGYARHLAARVRSDPRLELLAEPQLSICCFRYRGAGLEPARMDGLNAELLRRLRATTPYVPSTTVVGGRFAIRACYINPRTTLREVDGLADAVRRIGDELARAR